MMKGEADFVFRAAIFGLKLSFPESRGCRELTDITFQVIGGISPIDVRGYFNY